MFARILFFLLCLTTSLGAQVNREPDLTFQQTAGFAYTVLPDTLRDPKVITLAPAVRRNLNILADGLKVEFVVCLHGEVRGDTARVTSISVPEVQQADSVSVSSGPCQEPVLATWHNHPHLDADARDVPPENYCVMSMGDVAMAAFGSAPFLIISVDRSHMCWWTRSQAQQLTYAEYLQGYVEAVPGQYDFRGIVKRTTTPRAPAAGKSTP